MTCYSMPVRVTVCPDTPSQETKPALPCSGFIPATGRLLLQHCIPSTGTVAQQAPGTEAAEFRVFPPPSAPVSV
ncbi:hypothetical protein TURU_026535 [Turdus rufiventris]|nr:hypothetical protein TURU_026535 [Turdus rufiventris]